MQDAYLRLTAQGPFDSGPAERPGGVLFVDVEPGQEIIGLRDAPFELFPRVARVLVRWPDSSPPERPSGGQAQSLLAAGARVASSLDDAIGLRRRLGVAPDGVNADVESQPDAAASAISALSDLLNDLDIPARCGLLHQPVGQPAWVQGELGDTQELLARARAVELEALLEWGQAVWRPTTYHYQLPSGEHAAAFIKTADAIAGPRDAEVLASWLYPLASPGLGVVLDTGTLTSVVEALRAAMARAGFETGPTAVLDGYPATYVDVAKAVRRTARGGRVVALLSVNSSGTVRDRITTALASLGPGIEAGVEILVDKNRVSAHEEQVDGVRLRTWHPHPGQEPLVTYNVSGEEGCELCRDPQRARLIPINPRSFDGTIKAALRRITPSVTDADDNRGLWELCHTTTPPPIELEALPDEPVRSRRPPNTRMPVKFNLGALVAREEFRSAAAKRISDLMTRCDASVAAGLVLIPEHEFDLDGSGVALVTSLEPCLGKPEQVLSFPDKGQWNEKLLGEVRKHDSVAVLCLGSVTGGQLQQALVAIQHARGPENYDLNGFILHARPEQQRTWETLRNSYAGRLYWAWQTYLPARSPLRDELDVLDAVPGEVIESLGVEAERFLERRRRFIGGEIPVDDESIFWGSAPDDHLTPNSIFGQELRPAEVYAALGSSMERARKQSEERAAPERRAFEMSAIVRSYYDPLIISASLRWVQPHEVWWGWDPEEGRTIVSELLDRNDDDSYLRLLTAELLLAAAQGKLVPSAIKVVRAKAASLLERLDSDVGLPVALGLEIAPRYETEDKRRAVDGPGAGSRPRTTAEDLIEDVAPPQPGEPPA